LKFLSEELPRRGDWSVDFGAWILERGFWSVDFGAWTVSSYSIDPPTLPPSTNSCSVPTTSAEPQPQNINIMAPIKKNTKRKTTQEAESTSSYSCVSGSPNIFPNAKTVLIVPTKDAKRIRDALSEAEESLYKEWSVDDTTTVESIENLPSAFGHIVVSSLPKELPKKEHQLLQLLIDGKVSKTQYLVVEVRDGKRDYEEATSWVAFSCDEEDLLKEMQETLQQIGRDGDSCYVGDCDMVGSCSDPSLQKCSMSKLTEEDVQCAKDALADDWCTNEYLRGIS
jgi:hypothetical protein